MGDTTQPSEYAAQTFDSTNQAMRLESMGAIAATGIFTHDPCFVGLHFIADTGMPTPDGAGNFMLDLPILICHVDYLGAVVAACEQIAERMDMVESFNQSVASHRVRYREAQAAVGEGPHCGDCAAPGRYVAGAIDQRSHDPSCRHHPDRQLEPKPTDGPCPNHGPGLLCLACAS